MKPSTKNRIRNMRISVANFIEDYLSPLTFIISGIITGYVAGNYSYFWKGLVTGFASTWFLAMLLHFFPEWMKYPEWKSPIRLYQDCMAAVLPAGIFIIVCTVVYAGVSLVVRS